MSSINKKVFVGLSGGVDSSVSALLLKKQGYIVYGVFIKAWYPEFLPCSWRDEMRDAMRVCAKLDIPFLLCDLEKEYKSHVVDYLISEYTAGRTPNPDVMCNKYIKFDAFLNFALKHGADYIATGHYAKRTIENGIHKLMIPKDKEKDQTYFLWTLNQDRLSKILFPVHNLTKDEVRQIAQQNDLHTATKKDSQGLCFIGHVDMADFLGHFVKLKIGDVLDTRGKVIGQHKGAITYTIGQRHGFKIFNDSKESNKLFVMSKNIEKNTITVSGDINNYSNSVILLKQVNFTRPITQTDLTNIDIRIRYRSTFKKADVVDVEIDKAVCKLKIADTVETLALGQSIVFYRNNECLGGGIIEHI